MRRSPSEETVDDLDDLLTILRALRSGRRNANHLPFYTYTILLAIARHPEGTTMRELRSELALAHSSVTRACQSMRREGLVQIVRSDTDRRHKLVSLTQQGSRYIGEVLSAQRATRR